MECMTGVEYRKLSGPCVYVWKDKDGEILYVGSSSHGLSRPLGKHQVIGLCREVADDDMVEFIYFPTSEEARNREGELIEAIKPKFNKVDKNGRRLHSKETCKFCGEDYEIKRRWQKFCSEKCRTSFFVEKSRA